VANIEFIAVFGDEEKKVELNQSAGTAGFYQIMIGNYYHGQIIYQQGEWRVHLNRGSELNSDDCLILIEIVEANQQL